MEGQKLTCMWNDPSSIKYPKDTQRRPVDCSSWLAMLNGEPIKTTSRGAVWCTLDIGRVIVFWCSPSLIFFGVDLLRYQKWSKLRSKCNVTFNDNQLYLQDAIPVALEQSWVWPIGPSLWWQRDERPRDWLRSLDLSSWPKWDRLEREMRRICTPKWETSSSGMVFTLAKFNSSRYGTNSESTP